VQVSNSISSVVLVSTSTNGNSGIDIVASILDETGSPLAGHSLSCWIQSTCGLAQDWIPGTAESFSWLKITKTLNLGPGFFPSSASNTLFLPRYCSGAGYPAYV
jgi:hypothetical protein